MKYSISDQCKQGISESIDNGGADPCGRIINRKRKYILLIYGENSMRKRILSIIVALSIITAFCASSVSATMTNHSQTFSYPAGGYGYSSENIKDEAATKHSTKLTGVHFSSLPSGVFPTNDTKIYLTPVKGGDKSPIAYRNYHNQTHMQQGTIKHDEYFSGYTGTVSSVRLRAYSNYTSLGNTISAKWNFGYVNTL